MNAAVLLVFHVQECGPSTAANGSRVLTWCRVADDSRAVDFDPQAMLDDVKRLLAVKEDGVSGEVDSSSDASGDEDSVASSLEGLGKLGELSFMAQHYHSTYSANPVHMIMLTSKLILSMYVTNAINNK